MTTSNAPVSLKVRFARGSSNDFYNVLRRRVAAYFEEHQISKHGDFRMYIKTGVMLSLYIVPFIISFFLPAQPFLYWLMWMIMGLGISGIGLSVMHDASHGSYSKNRTLNKILSYTLNLNGGSAALWNIQHNMLHHTYTNIHGLDEDITRTKILRFSPHAKKMAAHKYQHYYAWVLYGLMTFSWVTMKEFKQVREFHQMGLMKSKAHYRWVWTEIILTKLLYYGYILVLPMVLMPYSFWFILLCFMSLHAVGGLILSLIFQPAHVIPSSAYPLPDEDGNVENNWAIHQILTTCNFSRNSRYFSWFIGGLNYQIEHHLFPRICHIHYPAISNIVRQTSAEFNLPYHSQRTWFSAIYHHGKLLRSFAKMD